MSILSALSSMRRFLNNAFAVARLSLTGDAASYYTWLGNDVVEGLGTSDHYGDLSTPLWMNLGYWKEARTYPDACTAMAGLLGEAARFQPEDKVLDVGFGFAEQDVYWSKRFLMEHIHGVNITPLHVEVGTRRVAAHGLSNRIYLQLGSATQLPFESESFDKVVALECAFHFHTRVDFFRQAYRVLRPGGMLATTDMLPAPDLGRPYRMCGKLTSRHAGVPSFNLYDRHAYIEKLRAEGFADVQVQSIRNHVYPGMYKYLRARYQGKARQNLVVDLSEQEIARCKGVGLWKVLGVSDYVVVTAVKPMHSPSSLGRDRSSPLLIA